MKSIVIAAPHSGSGKTTITLGIMECLRRRGLRVAPFKVGPDFIDPGYHRIITGSPSINLDGWMCGADVVRDTYAYHSAGADMAVIEGVMGLYDGIGGAGYDGSTAQIAALTGAPVILVVDAKSMAGSAAALVKGFARFDGRINVAAVIFNNVAGESHGAMLHEAMGALPEVKVLGWIPRDEKLYIPSRHLGLMTAEENPLSPEFREILAEKMERQMDMDALTNLPGSLFNHQHRSYVATGEKQRTVRVAVARDAAFCFVYEDNLRLLKEKECDLVEFSPLADPVLPADIGGVYLPGGYPELFADKLSANKSMKASVAKAVESGMPVYAECGGLIYLSAGVMVGNSTSCYDFVGIFPMTTRMLPKRKALGYRQIEILKDSILGKAGTVARGHEFHYSEIVEVPHSVETIFRVSKRDTDLGGEGFRYKNCLASYIHLHFGSCPELAATFAESCRNYFQSTSFQRSSS